MSTTVNVVRVEVALCVVGLLEIHNVGDRDSTRKVSSAPIKNVVTSWGIGGTEEKLQVTAKTTDRKTLTTNVLQSMTNQLRIDTTQQ